MEKSSHKNFVVQFWRNRDLLIDNKIIPYQNNIFDLFNDKFKSDAQKDWIRWRRKLEELWSKCGDNCEHIHQILVSKNTSFDEYANIIETVNNIVNMDYWSLQDFFGALKNKYKDITQIYELLNEIIDDIWEMRRISKKHTNIITK